MEMRTSTFGGDPPSHLRDAAAEEFCGSLPRQDSIAAQKLLCEELSRLVSNREPDERPLGALIVFDRHAHQISRRLLVQYAEGDAQLRSLDRGFFIAALRLSRSFAEAYERFLLPIGNSNDKSGHKSGGALLINSFRHRQVELLLRLFRYKKRNSEQWRHFHAAYRSAIARGWTKDSLPPGGADDKSPAQALEHQFIEVLLLGAMNTGQFSPRELLWASSHIASWRRLVALQSADAIDWARRARNGFVVDLRSADGLKRFSSAESGDFLYLDTAPLIDAIDKEVAALNDAATASASPLSPEGGGRIALLPKLRMLFAPDPVHVERRGNRKPVAYSVQAISGLPHIVNALREEAQRHAGQMTASAAQLEDITISPTRGHTRMSNSMLGAVGLAPFSLATTFGLKPEGWQVKDRSDSGCRMRGQTADLNGLIPGSLIAIRESENTPWTVAVIRRLRRLMVDHVEIGVEHIGSKPRFVKIVTDCGPIASVDDAPSSTQKCFGALYLPASDRHPTMPIKTLLIPPSAFNAGRVLRLLSSTATYTLRLNKPLEQQSEFVWTSFAVIDKAGGMSQPTPNKAAKPP